MLYDIAGLKQPKVGPPLQKFSRGRRNHLPPIFERGSTGPIRKPKESATRSSLLRVLKYRRHKSMTRHLFIIVHPRPNPPRLESDRNPPRTVPVTRPTSPPRTRLPQVSLYTDGDSGPFTPFRPSSSGVGRGSVNHTGQTEDGTGRLSCSNRGPSGTGFNE